MRGRVFTMSAVLTWLVLSLGTSPAQAQRDAGTPDAEVPVVLETYPDLEATPPAEEAPVEEAPRQEGRPLTSDERSQVETLLTRAAGELDHESLASADLSLEEASRLVEPASIDDEPLVRRTFELRAQLVQSLCARALDQLAQGRNGAAQVTLRRAASIQSNIEVTDRRAARAGGIVLVETRAAVRRTSQDRVLADAERAEAAEDYRRAIRLYGEAAELGADVNGRVRHLRSLRREPLLALGLSAVVPGAGQLYAGRELPAALFFLGVAGSVVSGILFAASADSRYDRYLAATNENDAVSLYDGVQERWVAAVTMFSLGGALYLWNVVDSFLGARSYNRERFEE